MNKETVDTFVKTCNGFVGNSNSLHKLGTLSKKLEDSSSKQILDVFNLHNKEVIYTSGRCESNNLVVFGLINTSKSCKNVVVTHDENSSILLALKSLSNIEIRYISCENGIVNIDELSKLIDNNTMLVSISNVVNVDEISLFLSNEDCYYHVDLSNNYNKYIYDRIDFITIEDCLLPGFAVLIKNKNIVLEPIFHGGKSTTSYRSGTPVLPFISSFSKLIRIKYKK